ncbi:hypothetical protein [Paenibacillus woosongensis]|uniref:DnaD domain-containing protein n=1 Tax=Paenibacillus woosongensis TaxID=307580 RepID=A0ABQ4MYZ6_9BACL|nr:hypothetical protein [Paenibacillus woosongensis]GIP61153.1 hypothetical protein J15TS10_49670 [Paenibacillus woosongensis]
MTAELPTEPNLSDLLNQFEVINGPEKFGPEGLSILITLWRFSSKLGWRQAFQVKNPDLQAKTGIKSRTTLNTHRSRLVDAGLISYTPPKRGGSNGDYVIYFDLINRSNLDHKVNSREIEHEAVQILNHYDEHPVQRLNHLQLVSGGVVQNLNHSVQKLDNFHAQPVQKANHFDIFELKAVQKLNPILKDIITNKISNNNKIFTVQKLNQILAEYSSLHNSPLERLRENELHAMINFLQEGMDADFIIQVMHEVYLKYSDKTLIQSFCYYEAAISNAWEKQLKASEGDLLQSQQLEKLKRMAREVSEKHGEK